MSEEYVANLPLDGPYDLAASLWLSSMGGGNPCQRSDSPTQLRMAHNSPEGPAWIQVQHVASAEPFGELRIQMCGAGTECLKPYVASMLGSDFTPPKITGLRKLRQIAHDLRGLRLVRNPFLFAPIVKIVLQQLISYRDACYGWRKLTQRYGTPVPEQKDLWYPPTPQALARLHSHHFIECGVLPQHGRRIVEVSRNAARIDAAWSAGRTKDAIEETSQLLLDLPGIGPWTVGQLRGACLGDADAEVLGDYGMPKLVSYFFEGPQALDGDAEPTDEDMLRLLEPYRPHRFYVLTLLNRGATHPPRRGPRRRSFRERF